MIWLVWVFVSGVLFGALVTVAVWLSRSGRLDRIIASEQGRQDISGEQEGTGT